MAKSQKIDGPEFNKLKPKTINQSKFVKAVENNSVIICEGPAGTGKTLLALNTACEYFFTGKVDKILISRTIIPCGDTVGFLPGTAREKAEPYFFPHLSYLSELLGKNYKTWISQEKIILTPTELLRGTTYHNTFMILDEAQNVWTNQIKMFLSRMGQNSKVVLCGDETQSDIDANGLRFCTNFLTDIDGCTVVRFDESDILRNDIIGKIIRVFAQQRQ